MKKWQDDKRWSDRFLTEIKGILGTHLIAEPPVEEDAERNTDLMVLKMDSVRVACRVRKHYYYKTYPCEFTIRAGRNSVHKIELDKIIEGWGDYMLYGFCDEKESRLQAWALCDLDVFRRWYVQTLQSLPQNQSPGMLKENPDGSSWFRVYRYDDLPKDFIVATGCIDEADHAEIRRAS